ncbi:hypothetical protein GGR61_001277 [Xanthomonas arboricola]|nr:hypothetical protein [Xanthomonas sp. 3058]
MDRTSADSFSASGSSQILLRKRERADSFSRKREKVARSAG